MMILSYPIALVLSVLCRFAVGEVDASFTPRPVWENIDYARKVNLVKSYPHEAVHLTIKNTGSQPESIYYFGIRDDVYEKLSMFAAFFKDMKVYVDNVPLPKSSEIDGQPVRYIMIKLPAPVEPGEKVQLEVDYAHNAGRVPLQERITLGSGHYMRLTTNKLPFTSYPTAKYSLEFIGARELRELGATSSTPAGDEEKQSLKLSPSLNTADTASANVTVTYRRDLPFPRVVNLRRDIWVSHWAGTLQFEEYYELTNDAAKLKGGFSRAEFIKGRHALKTGPYLVGFEMYLPTGATEHYYTDLVGMVSTHKVVDDRFFLKPRFPIFGGWFYNFTVGWTNELSQFLHSDASNEEHVLRVPILNGPPDSFYDNVELSVYLPEGAQVLDVQLPLALQEKGVTTEYSYFDLTSGHVKMTVKCKNIIDTVQKGTMFVKYRYSKQLMYWKPVPIALYVFVFLVSYFLLKRVDFSIGK
ncbi:AAL170Wp [Eremothecium gossypii ATCC 10895]|uniref:Dolichyl-diphosphooligosaccharide--protein glycosyltransferase subunit 1 n=1 Tax=Eremothecium gossypii (strain ATCC 10895 / CBS 109.51 / FGSC 9923 / NRRL Y-1056) TaxID=284811 RepID=Q75F86_EREGS|nr:AAL170Wp [Eremothecium gossypii ATCC 10895]AAS50196.1 AAL170Wp [Eremothecium gossypii ATCC 10895]AEY94481.1 FAAL170Wp [Eremothecium gossypii FDAG1]